MLQVFIFLLGTAIGSFLNVLIDRLSKEQSISGRSHCDYCKRTLAWYDLVPLISFILLRGKCRYCKKRLSWQYPIVEMVTGTLFVLMTNDKLQITNQYQITNFQISNLYYLVAYLGIISCLIVVFFSDAKYHIIPDQVQIALLIFSLIIIPEHGFIPQVFLQRALAAILVTLPIYFLHFITKGKGMGFGDVKLAFIIGFMFGIKGGLLVLYFAFISGAVVGTILMLLQKRGLKSKIAFGPFLVLGTITMIFWQTQIFELISRIYGI